jgi:hypothetical protein
MHVVVSMVAFRWHEQISEWFLTFGYGGV